MFFFIYLLSRRRSFNTISDIYCIKIIFYSIRFNTISKREGIIPRKSRHYIVTNIFLKLKLGFKISQCSVLWIFFYFCYSITTIFSKKLKRYIGIINFSGNTIRVNIVFRKTWVKSRSRIIPGL